MCHIPSHIIFFDGLCNLCNASVQFIIRNDSKDLFRFASLQSEAAKAILGDKYPDTENLDTIIYYVNGKILTHSTAILQISRRLSFPVNLLYVLMIVPPFVRNFFYRIISRNRYTWFGKKDQCMVPSDHLRKRFIDSLP